MSNPVSGLPPAPRPLTRRAALRLGGQALLGAVAASGCAVRSTLAARTAPVLAPVDVAWNHIIRRVVGLRPFRPAGFVLRAERQGDQLIVHNYGHGGGGISLSWGTAELAVREAEAAAVGQERRAAVLGCGVVGLATGRLLQRRGWAVTIYARDLPPRTTSNVAGGQWTPSSVFDRAAATPAFLRHRFTGYPSTFYPVFVNLMDNEIFWLRDQSPLRLIRLDAEGDAMMVEDNGPGVQPEDREAIFELGFTRKPGGRGLGLYISRDVLGRVGYELNVGEPPAGKGTLFAIRPKAERDDD